MERSLSKDPVLRKRYAYTKREDIKKSHLVTFKSQDPRLRFDLEWYLQHHPVISPNKPGKVRRVFNDAAKLHAPFLNQSLLVDKTYSKTLIFVILRFRQHRYADSTDIEGVILQVG